MLNKVLASILWGIGYAVSLLPLRLLYLISDIAFYIGYYLTSYRRSVIIQNLSRAFPDKKYKEIAAICRDFTRHFFNLFAEWIKLVSISEKELAMRVQYQNIGMLNRYYEEGRSVILVMGHYGNWESLSLMPHRVKQPVYAIYKRQSEIINIVGARMRSRFGVQLLESKEATRFVLRNKLNPAIYVFIADQSPSQHVKEQYSFMNQPTTAFAGAERLAHATHSAVVYVEVMRIKRGTYQVTFTEIPEDKSVTAGFLSALEKSIILSPQYWLWSHRRWKHRVE